LINKKRWEVKLSNECLLGQVLDNTSLLGLREADASLEILRGGWATNSNVLNYTLHLKHFLIMLTKE